MNEDLQIKILFTQKGIDHLFNAGQQGPEKLALVLKLVEIVKTAKMLSFRWEEEDKLKGSPQFGFINLKAKVKIFGKVREVKIVTKCMGKGKNHIMGFNISYYHHSVIPKSKEFAQKRAKST